MTDFIGMPVLDGEEILGAVFLANKICPPGAEEPCPEGSPGSDGTDGSDVGEKGPRKSRCGFTQEDEDLLRLLADHAAIALTNARLHERSRELTLAGERARIAHELHDAVSQKLFSLRLTAQASAALVDADPGRAKQEIRQVAALAAEAADELRAVVVELRPAALDEDGLVATLRTQVEVLDRVHSANVTFRSFAVRALPAAQEEALLRVAQEAVHNALRHSGARNVGVALEGLEGRGKGVRLRVRDDGRGFDPGAVRRSGRHLGLVSMRDRAGGVGGRLDVHSAPGKGTVIEMEVPGG
jgi:signal transduction histidine kinase